MDKKYKRKEDGFDFPSKRLKQENELEVTGVSRSGRVRKKSSKLMDFENLDEIDIRTSASKKKEKAENALASGELDLGRTPKKEQQRAIVKDDVLTDEDLGNASVPYTKQERLSDESENEMGYQPHPPHEDSSMESMGSDLDDTGGNDLGRVQSEGFQSIAGDADFTNTSQQSLYMMEKTNSKKKLVIKDGKIVGRTKTPKKDKGHSELSAYLLWAKEIRQELTRSDPQLDFPQTSKKLGELWATVPLHEKYIWKKRAKRASEGTNVKGGGGRTPSAHHNQQQQHQQQRHQPEGKKMRSPPGRKFINKGHKELASPPILSNSILSANASQDAKGAPKPHGVDQSTYKAPGTTVLDVAAHIRLLGESLTIIGERLTEHEGQIAVSGSVSVLLDTLLCVLAPLMCLTQQVPQMNVIPQEQLSGLMDNIAYIMPGL